MFCVSSVSMLQRKNDPALPEVEQKEGNEGSRAIEREEEGEREGRRAGKGYILRIKAFRCATGKW